jgi:hypothetical protein
MWRGLETGERRALTNLSIRFVPSHINSIFTVNTPISYLSCNKTICTQKKVIYLLMKKTIISKPRHINSISTVNTPILYIYLSRYCPYSYTLLLNNSLSPMFGSTPTPLSRVFMSSLISLRIISSWGY